MNTVRTLSTTQHSSLDGPIFSSTLLRPSADGEFRRYPTRGIAAVLLLAGAAAVAAFPIFAPRTATIATDSGSYPTAVVLETTDAGDSTGFAVVGAVAHPPAVNADSDALSLGSLELIDLLSTAAQGEYETEPAAVTAGDDSAGDSSDQGSGRTEEDQPAAGAAPADTSGTGDSGSDAVGGESAGSDGEAAGGDEGTGDQAAGSDSDESGDTDGDAAADNGDTGGDQVAGDGNGQGDGNGNGQGNGNGRGPSDNSQGNGPPQETPGNTPSGDNPGNGSPQGNPGGQSSGQGNGNGKK